MNVIKKVEGLNLASHCKKNIVKNDLNNLEMLLHGINFYDSNQISIFNLILH